MRLFLNKIFTFIGWIIFFLLLVILCYLSLSPVPHQQSAEIIAKKVNALHETAAVWVPHLDIDEGKVRQAHLPLFEKVEKGKPLTEAETQEYRQLYQALLLQHQNFFSHFDAQLVAITNLGMDQPNNVGGQGIEGHHDHHDESSRNNFSEIEASYMVLDEISHQLHTFFSFKRVNHAIAIYKNLNDILFHLATVPHTKSIHYHPAGNHLSADHQRFEHMLYKFKSAQFVIINSVEYQKNIHDALDEYEKLVLHSEKIVHQHLSPLELKLVGYWGGWQSLTPRVHKRVNRL